MNDENGEKAFFLLGEKQAMEYNLFNQPSPVKDLLIKVKP